MSVGRCGNVFARAANYLIEHPKATLAGLVTVVAIAALAALVAHGVPLDGAAGRALIVGLTLGTIGLAGLTRLLKKHDDKVIRELADKAIDTGLKVEHNQITGGTSAS